MGGVLVDAPKNEYVLAGSLDDLKAKGRLVVHGSHRPILVIYDRGAFSPWIIVAPIWVFRLSAAALKTAL